MGNGNAVCCKEIFPKIKNNELWLGVTLFTGKMPYFKVPDDYPLENERYEKRDDGKIYKQVNSIAWFTNVDHKKRHDKLDLCKKYNPTDYPKYDNYDAINVDKTSDIPEDYDGIMGVPITFLDKYNPDQFEIVGLGASHGKVPKHIPNESGCIGGKWCYARIFIKRKS